MPTIAEMKRRISSRIRHSLPERQGKIEDKDIVKFYDLIERTYKTIAKEKPPHRDITHNRPGDWVDFKFVALNKHSELDLILRSIKGTCAIGRNVAVSLQPSRSDNIMPQYSSNPDTYTVVASYTNMTIPNPSIHELWSVSKQGITSINTLSGKYEYVPVRKDVLKPFSKRFATFVQTRRN